MVVVGVEITIALRRTTLDCLRLKQRLGSPFLAPAESKAPDYKVDDTAAKDLLERGNRLLGNGELLRRGWSTSARQKWAAERRHLCLG
jgi:hypothetical protein